MATIPKFLVRLHEESGQIRITRSDGADLTREDALWFSILARNALRADSRGAIRSEVTEYLDEFGEVQGNPHVVDKMVRLFVQLRRWMRVPASHLGEAMGVSSTTVASYQRGHAQVGLFGMRAWAYMLQHEIIAVPFAIRKMVNEMITEYYASKRFEVWSADQYIDYLHEASRGVTQPDLKTATPVELKVDPNQPPEFDLTTAPKRNG